MLVLNHKEYWRDLWTRRSTIAEGHTMSVLNHRELERSVGVSWIFTILDTRCSRQNKIFCINSFQQMFFLTGGCAEVRRLQFLKFWLDVYLNIEFVGKAICSKLISNYTIERR